MRSCREARAKRYLWIVEVKGLPVDVRMMPREDTALPGDSVANVSQIITLDKTFLTERVSRVSDRIMVSVEEGIRTVLAL